jgi:hypothetical protein
MQFFKILWREKMIVRQRKSRYKGRADRCVNKCHAKERGLQQQGCQIFLGKTYQNGKKWPQTIPNGCKNLPHGLNNIPNFHKLYQQGPPKYTHIEIFGMQIKHLATLCISSKSQKRKVPKWLLLFNYPDGIRSIDPSTPADTVPLLGHAAIRGRIQKPVVTYDPDNFSVTNCARPQNYIKHLKLFLYPFKIAF